MIKKILMGLGLLATYFIVGSGNSYPKIKNQEQEEIGKAVVYGNIHATKERPFNLAESIIEEKRRHFTKEFALRRIKELEEQKNRSNYNKAYFYENALRHFKSELTDSEKVNLLERLLGHYENSLSEGDTMETHEVPYDDGYIEEEVSVTPEIRKRIKEIKSELDEMNKN